MKIGFWTSTPKSLDINEISADQIVCGGTERELLCLSKELHALYAETDNAHPIYVFGNVKERGGIFNHALFFHYEDLPKILEKDKLDVLIVARAGDILSKRKSRMLFGEHRPKKVILWSGDDYDQSNNEILYDRLVADVIDLIVLKGTWQKSRWLGNFTPIQNKPVEIVRKGVDFSSMRLERSKCSQPRFIYASTAFRGLERFLEIWPKIKEQISNATLDCYAKTTLYLDNNPQELSYRALYQQIEKLPGVTLKEPLPQKDFFKVLPSYYAMLYPNTFPETVCGVALEAMACGVPVITSRQAGLIETVQDGDGILIEGDPYSREYADAFVKNTVSLWCRPQDREWMSQYAFDKIRAKYNIKDTAQEWKRILDSLF